MERALQMLTIDDINNAEPVEIDLPGEDQNNVVEVASESSDESFKQNLAEVIPEGELQSMASEILDEIRIDKNSRQPWEKTVTDGMELLGLKIEERTEPWKGACGIFHSILSEAVIKFQSEMIMETFPATGPVQTKIIGKENPDKNKAADRVKEDMNWQLMDNMCEYRAEHERMLWNLGYAGSAFKKVYFDPSLKRQVSLFIPAEDMYLPYGCSDINNCPRITQVMRKTKNEILRLIDAGFYRDIDFGEPIREQTNIEKGKDKLTGLRQLEDDRYLLYECHTERNIVGFEDKNEKGEETGIGLPYVITLDTMGQVYAVYRNWKPDDKRKVRRDHFVQYTFIPGFGPYGMGYVHILGGYAKGSTSVLRQLVDAGTLANLPGGLKARGLRIKGDDTPIAPGEFRDVDVPAGTIRDNIVNLPYKEPSNTLFLLFKEIVDEGQTLASTADMKIADMNQQAPVGTTLAIIERMMKVMSAVQARVHAAMKKEFVLLKDIIRDYTPEEYDYDTDDGRMVKQSDYEHVDVIPVSDPNSSSTSQRIAQYQAALQLSQTAPQLYDLPELHRETLRVLGMKNAAKIVPDKDDLQPMDPVTENMAIMNAKPTKAFLYQDHKAHIGVHMALAQDPTFQQMIGQNPLAQPIQMALQAHLMEHVAFKYRLDIEMQMGVHLPALNAELPQDIEVQVSRLTAEAAPQVLAMHSKEAAAQQIAQQQQDPIVQMQQQELQIKGQEVQRKIAKDQADNLAEQKKLQIEEALAVANVQKMRNDAGLPPAPPGGPTPAEISMQQQELLTKQQDAARKAQIERERIASQERQNATGLAHDFAMQQRDHAHAREIEHLKREHEKEITRLQGEIDIKKEKAKPKPKAV